MLILVTGAGGFLPRAIVAALVGAGHAVRALERTAGSQGASPRAGVETVACDLRRGAPPAALLDGVEVVVHAAATTRGDDHSIFAGTVVATENLLTALRGTRVRRLVLCSSFSVYDMRGTRSGHDESSPLLPSPHAAGGYAAAKTWQERLARAACTADARELVILRPGFIWGRGREEQPCLGARVGRNLLLFGGARRPPLTYVENCADAFRAACEVPARQGDGEAFDIHDGHGVSTWHYAGAVLAGRRLVRIALPYLAVRAAVALADRARRVVLGPRGVLPSLFSPVRFEQRFKPLDCSLRKARERLGWSAPIAFADCVRRAAGEAP